VPLIALAHVPNAKLGAIIGHGSGMSSHALLASPTLETLYTIEIEPRMIEGSRWFYPANKRVFDDPRSKFIIDDAKSYFAATGQKFNVIISEPSNPWVSGVSGLFTREFYSRITRYLADDGIFAQWLHVYEISDGLVLSVLAALHHTFPSYQIFQTSGGDILIVASLQRALPNPDWKVFQLPEVRNDLRHVVQYDSTTLEATRILSRQVLQPLLDGWTQPNSDYYPILDLGAERTRFLRESAVGFSAMWAQGFNVAASLMSRRAGADDDKLAVLPGLGSVYFRALSARARRGGPLTQDDSLNFPALPAFQQAQWSFNASLASQTPPASWNRWFNDFVRLEEQLHSGTSGFIDAPFYSTAERFMDRHKAPQTIVQSVRFLRAMAEWNYQEVALAVDSLAELHKDGSSLLAADFLRDGGVIAKLRIGDVKGARADFDRLTNAPGTRPIGHFQTRLLRAHLEEAERAAGVGAAGGR
jgi:spermidine synthase